MLIRSPRPNCFLADERGATAIVFAVSCSILFGAVSLAIDTSRAMTVSTRVSSALDAAALAGAKLLADDASTDAQVRERTETYFQSAMNHMGVGSVTLSNFAVNIDRGDKKVNVQVDAKMRTILGGVIGINQVVMHKESLVVFDEKQVEVAMAFDLSGSMCNPSCSGRLDALKTAAKDAIDMLMENRGGGHSRNRIALVPWSASVNAGSMATSASGMSSFDDCVIERSGPDRFADSAPSYSGEIGRVPNAAYGYYSCPSASITPLMGPEKKSDLKSAIDSYTANGWTAGHIGAAWAWYMISPSWGHMVPGYSKPKDYRDPKVIKSVVLMSDGQFNTSYMTGEPSAAREPVMTTEGYSALQTMCTAMKERDIVVYTVAFAPPDPVELARVRTEFKACATSDMHYYEAHDGVELNFSFRKIAEELNRLRITR
jgi:Flp pilus assembly protein TadG